MDLSTLTIAEMQDLVARLPAEIDRRKAEEKQKVLEQMSALASSHGFSLDELVNKKVAGKKSAGGRKTVAVKYRHPANPDNTWTGRGRKPLWVIEWLESGNTLDAITVE